LSATNALMADALQIQMTVKNINTDIIIFNCIRSTLW
jgi:hypothetical protein